MSPPFTVLLVLLFLFLCIFNVVSAAKKPNIIFVLTDDQDVTLGGMEAMTQTRKLIQDGGALLENMFVNTPVCCPSRAEIVGGRYGHNSVVGKGGCMHHDITSASYVDSTMATHLSAAGYVNGLFGKYMNGPPCDCPSPQCKPFPGGTMNVPPGWDRWMAVCQMGQFFDNTWNNDSKPMSTGSAPEDYMTSVIGNASATWIRSVAGGDKPFMAYIAPHAPHIADALYPFWVTPAPWYENTIPKDHKAPRLPNWNASNEDKHYVMAQQPPLDDLDVNFSDGSYRRRLESLYSVDDLVATLFDVLKETGELDNTYVFYSSDHGWSLGEFRQPTGKWQVYDNHIRVPGLAFGPGITPGTVVKQATANIDFLPTMLDIAGGAASEEVDGKSMLPLLHGDEDAAESWRDGLLIEYWMLGDVWRGAVWNETCNPRDGVTEPGCPQTFRLDDGPNNTYVGLRVMNSTHNMLYAEFFEAGGHTPVVTNFAAQPPVFHELYNLANDPYQLKNLYSSEPGLAATLKKEMYAQVNCKGSECH